MLFFSLSFNTTIHRISMHLISLVLPLLLLPRLWHECCLEIHGTCTLKRCLGTHQILLISCGEKYVVFCLSSNTTIHHILTHLISLVLSLLLLPRLWHECCLEIHGVCTLKRCLGTHQILLISCGEKYVFCPLSSMTFFSHTSD